MPKKYCDAKKPNKKLNKKSQILVKKLLLKSHFINVKNQSVLSSKKSYGNKGTFKYFTGYKQ